MATTKKKEEVTEATSQVYTNPLMAALRENDKKNLFKTNVTTAFLKTGFPLFDYYFGAVINIHDEKGNFVRQEPRVGQAAGTFNLIIGNTGTGKAQPVDTMIPTPYGWKRLGDIKIGDEIFGERGQIIKVVGVFPQGKKKVYQINFRSGRTTMCSEEHLWKIYKGSGDTNGTVLPLSKILEFKYIDNIRFPKLKRSLQYPATPVILDPYIVGSAYSSGILDSSGRIMLKNKRVADIIADRLNGFAYEICPGNYVIYRADDINPTSSVPNDIMDIRTSAEDDAELKEIRLPRKYMENNTICREALLVGIFDACGMLREYTEGAYDDVTVRCFVNGFMLAEDIVELARSLGMDARHSVRSNNYHRMNSNEHETITTDMVDIWVPYEDLPNYFIDINKRLLAFHMTENRVMHHDGSYDYIAHIIDRGEDECVCIKVDNMTEMYLTNDFIPTHNTTLGAQITGNIIRPYKYSNAIHFDGENRFDVSRCETITGLPSYFFDGTFGGERYMIRSGMVGLDVIQEMIVKTYVTKMKLKDELMVPSGFKDEFGNDVMIFQPTVVLIDSMTTVLSETFNPDNTKEATDAEKMRGNTEGARDAKTLKGFFKDILPLCKEANIIIYGINHINSNMSMNAFIPPTRQQNYLAQDEIIPGGKTMIYYPFNIIKLTAKPGDDFTEEGDGFAGHLVMVEPIKSSSNQSGNKRKGVSFDLVFSHKQGFDSLRSTIMYGREYGIIEGNKTRMKFKDEPSFTFALKSIYQEKDEKPIWDCIKKFIIPHLMTHLSFVEPIERTFDERSMDY